MSTEEPETSKCNKKVISACDVVCPTCYDNYNFVYIGADMETVEKLNEEYSAAWRCPKCKAIRTRARTHSPGASREDRDDDGTDTEATVDADEPLVMIDRELEKHILRRVLNEEHSNLEKVTSEYNKLKKSLEDGEIHECPLKTTISSLENRLREMEHNVADFETERGVLRNTIKRFQDESERIARIEMSFQVEIVGVPQLVSENLRAMILAVARKFRIALDMRDIDWISRVGHDDPRFNPQPRTIAVRFVRRMLRDDFVRAARLCRRLTTEDLNWPAPNVQVYVNERITKRMRILFRAAKDRARVLGQVRVWIYNGLVYLKKHNGRTECVLSHNDLYRVLPLPDEL